MRRRLYLATVASAVLAGCSDDGGDGNGGTDDGGDETEATTEPDATTQPETTTDVEASATLSQRWEATLETDTASGGTYAADATADGLVVGNTNGMYSYSPDGERQWSWDEPQEFENPGFGAVAADGDTVFGAATREVVVAALEADDGSVRWRREAEPEGNPIGGIVADGYFVTPALDPTLAVLDRDDGETVATVNALNPQAVFGYDGTLVVSGFQETTGYDPATGEEQWTAAGVSTAAGVAGNVMVAESDNGELIGLDLDAGEVRWTESIPEDVNFPTISGDGDHAVVQWRRPSNTVRAVSAADGSTVWEKNVELQTIPFAPVLSDGVVVADGADGYLALDVESGSELGTATTTGVGAFAADASAGVFYACSTSVTAYDL